MFKGFSARGRLDLNYLTSATMVAASIDDNLPATKLIKNFEDFQIGEGYKKGAPR